jgi:hypothetical protein
MSYTAEISRTNPTCFLFLVDQSGSMSKPFGVQQGKSKAQGVADAINRLLQNLVLKCSKLDGIRDYFHIGVIGYGQQVAPAFAGDLAGRPLSPVSAIANNPLRVDQRTRKVADGVGGLVDQLLKFPVWFEPISAGKTPMCQALQLAQQIVTEFLQQYPDCFPPVVLNITDGKANDGDPRPAATALRKLASSDGNVLLFNAHLSTEPHRPIEYPDQEKRLPDDFARLLFQMSSPLPSKLVAAARQQEIGVSATSRGFVFNADLVAVIRFMDIGTQVSAPVR